MAISSLFCIGMGRLGDIWIGCPFRPVGFVLAFSFALDGSWNLFLVVWLIKLLIMRYGGLRIYRQAAPLFLGMALGDAIAQVMWGAVAGATGAHNISVYLPPRW